MSDEKFYLKVAYALSGCQLVEQELKLYITQAMDLVRKCVEGKMTFTFKGDDYADASLERLIETFKNLENKLCRIHGNERRFHSWTPSVGELMIRISSLALRCRSKQREESSHQFKPTFLPPDFALHVRARAGQERGLT